MLAVTQQAVTKILHRPEAANRPKSRNCLHETAGPLPHLQTPPLANGHSLETGLCQTSSTQLKCHVRKLESEGSGTQPQACRPQWVQAVHRWNDAIMTGFATGCIAGVFELDRSAEPVQETQHHREVPSKGCMVSCMVHVEDALHTSRQGMHELRVDPELIQQDQSTHGSRDVWREEEGATQDREQVDQEAEPEDKWIRGIHQSVSDALVLPNEVVQALTPIQ